MANVNRVHANGNVWPINNPGMSHRVSSFISGSVSGLYKYIRSWCRSSDANITDYHPIISRKIGKLEDQIIADIKLITHANQQINEAQNRIEQNTHDVQELMSLKTQDPVSIEASAIFPRLIRPEFQIKNAAPVQDLNDVIGRVKVGFKNLMYPYGDSQIRHQVWGNNPLACLMQVIQDNHFEPYFDDILNNLPREIDLEIQRAQARENPRAQPAQPQFRRPVPNHRPAAPQGRPSGPSVPLRHRRAGQ